MDIRNIRLPDGRPCASPMDAVEKFKCPGPCNPDCPLNPSIRISGETFGHMCHPDIIARYPLSALDAMRCSYQIHVGGPDPGKPDVPERRIRQQLYAAVISSSAVRDAQFAATNDTDPLSEDWRDLESAELWLGFFRDPRAREQAARFGNTVPENVRLIPVDPDMEVERYDGNDDCPNQEH